MDTHESLDHLIVLSSSLTKNQANYVYSAGHEQNADLFFVLPNKDKEDQIEKMVCHPLPDSHKE